MQRRAAEMLLGRRFGRRSGKHQTAQTAAGRAREALRSLERRFADARQPGTGEEATVGETLRSIRPDYRRVG
jgi:hypothetical protein